MLKGAIVVVLDVYSMLLLIRILFSFVNYSNQSARPHQIIALVYRLTDVTLKPIQKIIKPVLIGNTYLDFVPLIVLFIINLLQRYI